ncbi:MAG: ABC transporter ATP-binding protein [Lachnospiraceae bacterium]|nr:ABC transporter ATP-binding protein [Ruminococcus sp.]MCM1276617.1 ABC transporter ATP-binding protein [Lachnospiraceae bacterium]
MGMELSVKNIEKIYGKKCALKNVSLNFHAGVYGLLGLNGAGKSTLIGTITGLAKPDRGAVVYKDESGSKLHDKLGYLPQYQSFYKNYSAYEFLKYMCALKNFKPRDSKKYCGELLDMVNLSEAGNKKIGAYSGGMKQRLGIAQALIGESNVLIFDEPTAGLDPKERVRFRNIISSLGSDRIVILATHIVSDISCIANEIILLYNGEVKYFGTESDIVSKVSGKAWECSVPSKDVLDIMGRFKVSNVVSNSGSSTIKIVSDEKPFENAVSAAPDLEDVCLYEFGEL